MRTPQGYEMDIHCALILISFLSSIKCVFSASSNIRSGEFCETEIFKAVCDADEVIMMKAARYGRMKIGSCVRKDLGYIGCYTDVLHLADKKCSGRRQCDIRIPDPSFDSTRPCLEELKTYLEAAYECIKVHVPENNCLEPGGVVIQKPSGYLSSLTTLETLCGTETTPWVIQAQPGQLINVTFYDFNLASREMMPYHLDSPSIAECEDYAYLLDPTARRKIKICPGRQRVNEVYVSLNHSLEVAMRKRAVAEKGYYFLLHYQIQGCPGLSIPDDMFFRKLGDKDGVVGCLDAPNTWPVTCIGNEWVGKWDNCTRYSVVRTRTDVDNRNDLSAIVVVGIICIVVVMMCTVIGVGGFCLRRFFHRRPQATSYDMAFDDEDAHEPFKPPEDTIINDLTRDSPKPCPIHHQEQYAIAMQNKQNNRVRQLDGNDYSPIPQRGGTNLETELMREPFKFAQVHTLPCDASMMDTGCTGYKFSQSRTSVRFSPGRVRKLQYSPNNRKRKNTNKKLRPKSQLEILHVPYPQAHHEQCLQGQLPNVVILDQVKSNPRYSVLYKLMELNKDNTKSATKVQNRNNMSNLNNTI